MSKLPSRYASPIALVIVLSLPWGGVHEVKADPALPAMDQGSPKQLAEEYNELKNTLHAFNDEVDSVQARIAGLSNGGEARAAVAQLQVELSKTLSSLADNGRISVLGQSVLSVQRQWKKEVLARDYGAERIETIEKDFQNSIDKTEKTIARINEIRKQLTASLKRLQVEQDYLLDLERADDAKQMAQVLEELLQELKATSVRINGIASNVPGV